MKPSEAFEAYIDEVIERDGETPDDTFQFCFDWMDKKCVLKSKEKKAKEKK